MVKIKMNKITRCLTLEILKYQGIKIYNKMMLEFNRKLRSKIYFTKKILQFQAVMMKMYDKLLVCLKLGQS
jgi:hypothetical protein